MDPRAMRNQEHRRLLLKGLGLSAVVHAIALGSTFDVVDPRGTEPPRVSREMSRPPLIPTPVQIVRLSSRSTAPTAWQNPAPSAAPSAAPPSTPPEEAAASPPTGAASAAPEAAPEGVDPWDAPLEAGLPTAVLDQVALIDATATRPVVFGDLNVTSPEPPVDGRGESDAEEDGGGWLSGIAGIFGDIGLSLDGGICPVPSGRAGWR